MATLTGRLLAVIERDVVPLTRAGVAGGNKVFGAAMLRKDDWSLVVAATNAESENPLWHGEMACLNAYWRLPPQPRPLPKDCLFVSTHEPCSLCLSAITWSGCDNFYYLFSYQDSRDDFAIPHDLRILEEVFGCADGDYRRHNAFWHSHSITAMIAAENDVATRHALEQRVAALRHTYAELSATYQQHKGEHHVPFA